ncbi:MAG TPA: BON domain-containing protein [Bryobacteraceae bacterium]|jgi:hyperosmotically inducible protein
MMRKALCSTFVAALLAVPGSFAVAQSSHEDSFVHGSADEGRIAKEVRHQLIMLPYYSIFDDLGFQVQGSTVTLVGAVTRPTLKSDAENVVKRIEGVSQVKNEIRVLPLSNFDSQTRRALARAIYGDPQIGTRYGNQALPSIHIIVDNGKVTLEGVVSSDFDKNLIGMRANSVPNVFSVTNNLRVVKD